MDSRKGSSEKNIRSNFIVLSIFKYKTEDFKPTFMNLVPGVFEIHHFYNINRVYRISNTPGTKFVKFDLRWRSILHFKMYKTIKFERIFFSLEPFLESLQDVHVNNLVTW